MNDGRPRPGGGDLRFVGAVGVTGGTVFAVSVPFSGLALAAVIVLGTTVAAAILFLPWPTRGTPIWGSIPARAMRPWLVWLACFAVVEVLTLVAGDELAWPTLSAIQDPVTGHPVGRFVTGALWTACGIGLVVICGRGHPVRPRVWVPALILGATWAAWTLTHGAVLSSRDAPSRPDPGVDNQPLHEWPVTAGLTIAAFAAIAAALWWIDRRARRGAPWATLPQALTAAAATVPGRVVTVGWWWWSGWHFLAR